MKKFTIICVILLNVIGYAVTENQCIFQDNCERCLSTSLECAWCTDKAFELRHRCLRREQLIEYGCSADNIYENEPEAHPLKDLPVKDYESANDLAVQVQPQKVYLKLVKGQPQQVKLTYRPARNNPLDLYILMDLTWTMRDDKETLVKLGSELTHTLRNLTANYRLGFGSFADKPVMPMMQEPSRANPCANEGFVCVPTYGYKHHLGLTDDVAKFVSSVNASRITANLDNLEGGLDALMQVLVCPQQIGWRDEARKIVILVTDGFMHFAGDGLLAGITRPNDKKCHLNEQGDYLGSLEYDYPSLEEIYRELVKRKVNVIFAVTSQVVNTYQQMSTLMQEISNVDILSADSSNILELIKKSYESFIKRTQFSDNSPKFIETLYETDCGGQFEFPRRRSYCNDIALGTTVDFYVNFTLTDYPKDGVYTHKIRVEESSLSEYLEVEVEIQKPCPCDEPQEPTNEYGRIQCSDHGYLQCGMCQCDEQWTGTFCSCPTDSTNRTTNEALENMCRPPVVGEAEGPGEICSKRGECECGECFCLPGYTGTYCECEDCDSDCDLERADCLCGTCVCKAGWSGPKCECSDSKESCQGPNGDICSLRGRCQCDECVCDEPYLGRFCEIGSDTENKLCSFFEPCVSCLIKQKLDLGVCENVTELCSSPNGGERFQYGFVTEDLDTKVRCLVRIENQHGIRCDHYFSYSSLKSTENYLVIQANPCEPLNYVALFGFATAMTILLGLLIIFGIWFYLRSKDRREFAKFNEDQRLSVLNESPLYKDPITRYTVPEQVNRRKASNPFR